LEQACEAFCELVNARVHRVTRRTPVQMLGEERARLHPLPPAAHTVAFGVTRTVARTTPMVTYEHCQYSVPHRLLDQVVWVRVHGQGPDEQVVIVHVGDRGPVEVARHLRATPGSPAVNDEHFPPAPAGALGRQPRPGNAAEAEFLTLGEGARTWLTEAAAAGTSRMRIKMADAVALARLGDPTAVDWALGHAAVNARFAERDLPSIITHHASAGPAGRRQPGQGGSPSSSGPGSTARPVRRHCSLRSSRSAPKPRRRPDPPSRGRDPIGHVDDEVGTRARGERRNPGDVA